MIRIFIDNIVKKIKTINRKKLFCKRQYMAVIPSEGVFISFYETFNGKRTHQTEFPRQWNFSNILGKLTSFQALRSKNELSDLCAF